MLELEDIQGLVLSGYGHMNHACLLFLRVDNGAAARVWLQGVIGEITTAARRPKDAPKPKSALNVAVTCAGLNAMGLPDDAQCTFPTVFREGMAWGERPRVLGDTGEADPECWEVGGPKTPEAHLLLLLYADSAAALEDMFNRVAAAPAGWSVVYRQESFRHGVNEPFGFRDGISQPAIEGAPGVPPAGGDTPIKAGEFLLGYPNEYKALPPSATVSAAQDAKSALPAAGDRRDFGRNGSYLVIRKLSQDVPGFWGYLSQQATGADGRVDMARREWLAAKMMGRWPSGAPLTLAENDDPELGKDERRNNDFNFAATDARGTGCPVGAHIRRCNPRDSLVSTPGTTSFDVVRRHRIIRRGRPFGPPYVEGQPDGDERGIVFMCLNADIQQQFEFIQQTWVNSPKFEGLVDNKDPIVGDNDGTGHMVIPGAPVRQRVPNIPRFVQMKGGGYFFLPGMRALRFLAQTGA